MREEIYEHDDACVPVRYYRMRPGALQRDWPRALPPHPSGFRSIRAHILGTHTHLYSVDGRMPPPLGCCHV